MIICKLCFSTPFLEKRHHLFYKIFQVFKCPLCGVDIVEEEISTYLKHVNRHIISSSVHQFDCPICMCSHYNISQLKKHLATSHGYNILTCKRKRDHSLEIPPSEISINDTTDSIELEANNLSRTEHAYMDDCVIGKEYFQYNLKHFNGTYLLL